MKSIAELVAAYQADKLKLPAVFEALSARGVVPAAEHQAEVAWLERQRDEEHLESIIVKALIAKLAAVQATTPAADVEGDNQHEAAPAQTRNPPVDPGDDDATRVQPASRSTPPPDSTQDDATVVKPASRPAPPPELDDITVVKPATRVPRPAEPTPVDGTSGTRGATGTSSSINQSSWQHIAEAEGGDFVTVGSLLKGRFHLEREIGRGGMGVVFLARDERKVEARDRDPYVAIKVLNDEFRRHPDSLISLQRESRRSQQLAHDNIVRVFDFDKDRTIVFMTMEYIDGSDLKSLIRENAYHGMPLSKARALIEGMARALTRAHAAGVVHSDFKPANVMVTREGVPKVFDFGIARAGKHMGDAVGEQTVFDAGTLGALTPAYASLEMIQGKDPVPGDDIYALGCVVFELLTGKHPYDKVSAEVAMKEGRKLPAVPGLTKRQYKVLCTSVAFRGEQRLKSASELVEGLREVGVGERVGPYLRYGLPAVLVIAGGVWAWNSYQHRQHLADVIGRFGAGRADTYLNETQALKSLNTLNDDERKRLVIDQSDLIQSFLMRRLDAYWNPAKERYDYAGTRKVFQLRDDLKLYSPALDIKRTAIEDQKNDLLNTLDTQLNEQIAAGAIFEKQPNNVVATLARIRAIDPTSALLNNAELELNYDTAIGKSLSAGNVDAATAELTLARSLFPDSARLKERAQQLQENAKALAALQLQEQQAKQLQQQREQTLATLVGLLDNADNSNEWRDRVVAAYNEANKILTDDPRVAAQVVRLKQVLEAQALAQQTSGDLAGAIDIAGFGVNLFPGEQSLAATRQSLLDQQSALAQKAATEAQRNAIVLAKVDDLLARPLGSVVWLQDVKSALENARKQIGAESPTYAQVRGKVHASLIKLARVDIASGELDVAARVAQAGQEIDPTEARYGTVLAEVETARAVAQQNKTRQQAKAMADARASLAELGAHPKLTPQWQRSVAATMATLNDDTSPQTARVTAALGAAIAKEAAALADPQHLAQARSAVDFGLKYVPQSAPLLAQSAKLDTLAVELQAKAAQESAAAEVKSRIESMKSAVAAGDVRKASQSLARIRVLQPDNPFLKVEGPKLLADAYLGQAEDTFQQGHYQKAADVLGQGLRTLAGNAQLQATKARYKVVADIMAAGGRAQSSDDYARLARQFAVVHTADAKALGQLEEDMRKRGQLSGGRTLATELERLKPISASPVPTVESRPAAPTPAAVVPTRPSVKPGRPPAAATPAGADPCAKPGLAGRAKFCFDNLNGARGPILVVIPGISGGKAYALSRTEISINQFNAFCRATGKCAAKSVSDPDLGNAPVSNISLDQARAYARWLGDVSGGYAYRLPTDAEWAHAAGGGRGWKQAQDSNCILPSAGGGDAGAVVSGRGRSRNPWGLVNMTGNVWEWVVSGNGVMKRGGSFNSYWSDCTVDARQMDDGSPQKDVGFRVLRELK